MYIRTRVCARTQGIVLPLPVLTFKTHNSWKKRVFLAFCFWNQGKETMTAIQSQTVADKLHIISWNNEERRTQKSHEASLILEELHLWGVVHSQALRLLEKVLRWLTELLFPSSMQCSAGWGTHTELCTLLSLSDQHGSILFWHHPQILFLLYLWSILSALNSSCAVFVQLVQWPCLMARASGHNGVRNNNNHSNNTNIKSLWGQSFHNVSQKELLLLYGLPGWGFFEPPLTAKLRSKLYLCLTQPQTGQQRNQAGWKLHPGFLVSWIYFS